jgi:hypothetical protein
MMGEDLRMVSCLMRWEGSCGQVQRQEVEGKQSSEQRDNRVLRTWLALGLVADVVENGSVAMPSVEMWVLKGLD